MHEPRLEERMTPLADEGTPHHAMAEVDPIVALFSGWDPIIRILTIGPLAYAALVVPLRVSGKRTVTKLNAFDRVVVIGQPH